MKPVNEVKIKNTDVMKNQYGSSYEGEVVNGIPHGKGMISYLEGDKYEGDMKRGMKHGKGTLTTPDGYKYEGEFRNDKQKDGLGTMTFPNGNIKNVVVNNGFYEIEVFSIEEENEVHQIGKGTK
jgi:hypothetical protein